MVYFLVLQKMYKFINKLGHYMIDLIELTESQYVELNYTTGYIFFAYCTSNHLIFTKFIKTKSADVTAECLKELFTYLENDKI